MSSDSTRPPAWMSVAYAVIALFLICIALLPLSSPAHSGPPDDRVPGLGAALIEGSLSPDILAMLTFAWLLRRPDQLPFWLIVAVFLLRDLLTGAPPGVDSLAMLLASEWLRQRHEHLREVGFLLEWWNIAMFTALMMAASQLITALLFWPLAPIGMQLSVLVSSILAYPLTVVALRLTLGLRKTAPGSLDDRGHRI